MRWLFWQWLRVLPYRVRFPGQARFSRAAARALVGKRILVEVTERDYTGFLLRQDDYHGRIVRLSRQEGIVIQRPSGEQRTLPPDLRCLFHAPRGLYECRSTGEIVTDPDILAACSRFIQPPTT